MGPTPLGWRAGPSAHISIYNTVEEIENELKMNSVELDGKGVRTWRGTAGRERSKNILAHSYSYYVYVLHVAQLKH